MKKRWVALLLAVCMALALAACGGSGSSGGKSGGGKSRDHAKAESGTPFSGQTGGGSASSGGTAAGDSAETPEPSDTDSPSNGGLFGGGASSAWVPTPPNVEESEDQLQVIADNEYVWRALEDEWVMICYFMVTDLDWDGNLELVASTTQGTGSFSQTRIYEVNGNGLTEWSFSGTGDCMELDILLDETNLYVDGGTYHYAFSDYIRSGWAWNATRKAAMTLGDQGVYWETPIAYREFSATQDGDDYLEEETYSDVDGNEITEEEYANAWDSFFQGLPRFEVTFGWISFDDLYTEDTLSLLRTSLEQFTLWAD